MNGKKRQISIFNIIGAGYGVLVLIILGISILSINRISFIDRNLSEIATISCWLFFWASSFIFLMGLNISSFFCFSDKCIDDTSETKNWLIFLAHPTFRVID